MINFKTILNLPNMSPDQESFYRDVQHSYEGRFKIGVVSRDGTVDLTFKAGPMSAEAQYINNAGTKRTISKIQSGTIMVFKGIDLLELENVVRQLVHTARSQWPHDEHWMIKRDINL